MRVGTFALLVVLARTGSICYLLPALSVPAGVAPLAPPVRPLLEELIPARTTLTALGAGLAWCLFALPVSAQITTGTVSGTVRDAQDAMIPGAAVTLVSETRGTRMREVFTSSDGDFVF